MALVAYPDSDSEDAEDEKPVTKKARLCSDDQDTPPPLPPSFLNLYSSTVRVSNTDDPSLHLGRKRVVKHVEGNWASHVYLEWHPSPHDHDTLNRLLHSLPNPTAVHSLLQTPLAVPLPLHISLSAPLVLRTETKDQFLQALTDQLTPIIRPMRRSIALRPAALSWHPNEDNSRYFLVLRLENPHSDDNQHGDSLAHLNNLLRASNRVAQNFGQPQLYTGQSRRNTSTKPTGKQQNKTAQDNDRSDFSPYFHISVAWALPSPHLHLQEEELTRPAVQAVMKEINTITVPFEAVKIRIGQSVTTLPFGSKPTQSRRGILA